MLLFSLIVSGCSMRWWLPEDQGQTQEQVRHSCRTARKRPWEQGWAKDDVNLQAGFHGLAGLWQSWRAALMQRHGVGWTALGWAEVRFHRVLEIYVFV